MSKGLIFLATIGLVVLLLLTGFSVVKFETIDTDTHVYEHYGSYYVKGKKFLYGDEGNEIMDDSYVSSWYLNEYSMTIVVRDVSFHYRPYPWEPFSYGIFLGQYAWVVNFIDSNGKSTKIIDGANNYVDTDMVYLVSGNAGGDIPNSNYLEQPGLKDEHNSWGPNTWMAYGIDKWYQMSIPGLSFKLKGRQVGIVKAICILEFAELEIKVPFYYYHGGQLLICSDQAMVKSGVGKIIVSSVNAIGSAGEETNPETGVTYTKYVYEEGSTVTFEIDADYSGRSLKPDQEGYGKGWAVELYNNKGVRVKVNLHGEGGDDPYVWVIPTEPVRGYTIRYTIPEGAFVPNDPHGNEWRVVLKNTLFDQSEDRLFVVDTYKKMPGKPIITLDRNEYNQWDTVEVTLTAEANPDGTNDIHHFRVWAKYGSVSSTDYAYNPTDVPASHVSGLTYTGSFSFQLKKGDKYVYIRAHAVDSDGRASVEAERNIYSRQTIGKFKITVFVTSGIDEIENASVEIGNATGTTGSDGKVELYVYPGSYTLHVKKIGYIPYVKRGVKVFSDTSIHVELLSSMVSYAGIATGILVLLGSILFAYLYPSSLQLKIIILSIGLVVSIFLFLIFSGIIYFGVG